MKIFDSIVFLSAFPWNGVWQTPHYLAHQFANHLPVLYVEPPPVWNPKDPNFCLDQLLQGNGGRRVRQEEGGVRILTPHTFPFGRWDWVRRINQRTYAQDVSVSCARWGIRTPLFWLFYYEGCLRNLEALGSGTVVYHGLDYCQHAEEEEVVRRADLVFAVSRPLLAKYQSIHPRTYLLPNGVNLEWFEGNSDTGWYPRPTDLPKDRQLLGFVGTINRHVDFRLLLEVASALPSQCLVLVGPVLKAPSGPVGSQKEALRKLQLLPNVRFTGFKQPHELPRYIGSFHVCLMPFLDDEKIRHSDPLKFYQYIALGKPVVTISVPMARECGDISYFARSHEEFLQQIEHALHEPRDADLVQKRLALARAHSWPSLTAQACERLRDCGLIQHGEGAV